MQNQNVYWDRVPMSKDDPDLSILAVGDSWVWYAFPGVSRLSYLGGMVATGEHTILGFGNNGAEAYDQARGTYAYVIGSAYRCSLSAVLISGGGNNFARINDLRRVLDDNCAASGTAPRCGPWLGCVRTGATSCRQAWVT